MPSATWDEDARHLATVAFDLIAKHRAHPRIAIGKSLVRHLCREVEDLCPRYVSVKAHEAGLARGLSDLRQFHWDDQPYKMGDRGRILFHWDHFVPVAQLFRELTSLPATATPEDAHRILRRARIAWISKEETVQLSRNGFSAYRANPYEAYRSAGIELLHVAEDDEAMWGGAS